MDLPKEAGSISIVIVTHNQSEFTMRCLESIARCTPELYDIVIVDNASTDDTRVLLSSYQAIKIIENIQNLGFPAAANQGISATSSEYIVLLNNDVVVTPGWLGRLRRALDMNPDLGLVGPITNAASGPQQVQVSYSSLNGLDKFADGRARLFESQIMRCDRLVGFCLMFKRSLVSRIGLLDERFGMGNFEDDDYCLRAALAGFELGIVLDCFVHHYGSTSFRGSGIDLGSLLEENRRIFQSKWKVAVGNSAEPSAPVCQLPAATSGRLSLCMIVRDSARTLIPCLESIRPWVDEMIVVDTGSKDDTQSIARRMGARVFEYPWRDDFAAARNESLRHATGDWILWMDSDDTIDVECGKQLRQIVRELGSRPSVMGFVIQVRCPFPNHGDSTSACVAVDHVKLFRNHGKIFFSGRIHEQVLPSIRQLGGEVIRTEVFVVHSGADQSPEGVKRKHQRDLHLLELELKDNPDHTFTLFNMGMTLVDMGDFEKATNYLCRSLQMATNGESHIRKIYALLVQSYASQGRLVTALKTCQQGLSVCPADPELTFRMGTISQSLGHFAAAEAAYLKMQGLRNIDHFSSVDRGIFDVKAWQNLAVLYESQGHLSRALGYWRKLAHIAPADRAVWIALLNATRNDDVELKWVIEETREKSELRDWYEIASAYLLAIETSVLAAIQHLQEYLPRAGPYLAEVLETLGRMAFECCEFGTAEVYLEKLSTLHPTSPSVFLNLAFARFKLGDLKGARAAVEESLRLRSGYAQATALLGEISSASADSACYGSKSLPPAP